MSDILVHTIDLVESRDNCGGYRTVSARRNDVHAAKQRRRLRDAQENALKPRSKGSSHANRSIPRCLRLGN